jgi:hypothetical protein
MTDPAAHAAVAASFFLFVTHDFFLTSFSCHSTLKGFIPALQGRNKSKGAIPKT